MTAPNGDTEAYTFDALNRTTVEASQTGGAVSLFNYQYIYDLASNVTSVVETYPSGLNNRTVTSAMSWMSTRTTSFWTIMAQPVRLNFSMAC